MVKIKVLKSVITINPERFWKEGEVVNIDKETAEKLKGNPYFEFLTPKVGGVRKKTSKKRKKMLKFNK